MEVLMLEKDGRCLWLENKVLKGLLPVAIKNSVNPFAKKLYVIVDWISNDYGRVGVDLKWLKSIGVPVVRSVQELPAQGDFKVVNTGYDSIVEEEKALREKGVEILDKPCPFIRRVRSLLEEHDGSFQYVLLCEPNHIIIKNFSSLFPEDLILVQMENYQQRITEQANGKPMRLLPYVTFLESDAQEILSFIREQNPGANHDMLKTACMWVTSKASPIVEIDKLDEDKLSGINEALVISTLGTTNKSVISMEKSLTAKGLKVVSIGTLWEFIRYERKHRKDRVLLVRSPIPNQAEKPIMQHIEHGFLAALWVCFLQLSFVQQMKLGTLKALIWLRYRLQPSYARAQAEEHDLLRARFAEPVREPEIIAREH